MLSSPHRLCWCSLVLVISAVTAQSEWDIGVPAMSYRGLQLDLEYTVGDQVRSSYVDSQLFMDEDCTKEIPDDENDFIFTDVVNDLTPFGDGSGTREVTLSFNIDHRRISESPIITFTDAQGIVAFCVQFRLEDPSRPGQFVNFRNTPVAVGIDLTQNIEITGLITDNEEEYLAEAFECDDSNLPVSSSPLKNQGSAVRICVRPNALAREFGVTMQSINSLRLVRGDVNTQIIAPNGVVQNFGATTYSCGQSYDVCSVETIVLNEFYYSSGTVNGDGAAWLMYGLGTTRRLIRAPIRPLRDLRTAGGFIGSRDFSFDFQVTPSAANYGAVAYECDVRNLPLSDEAKAIPKIEGQSIRICVVPNQEARSRGVFMRSISSFYFEQNKNAQFAVESGEQSDDGSTLLICNPGDSICAFRTILDRDFFKKNTPVEGRGEIILQFGEVPPLIPGTRRDLMVEHGRATQVNDAGFAGQSTVFLNFTVDPDADPFGELTWKEKASEWWSETPLFLRIVYVACIVLAFLILLCFLYAICCANPFGVRDKGLTEDDPDIVFQPVYVAPPANEEDEEGDFADALNDPELHRIEEEGEDEERPKSSRRGMPVDEPKPQSFKKLENGKKSPKPSSTKSLPRRGGSKSPKPQSTKSMNTPNSTRRKKKTVNESVKSPNIRSSVSSPKHPVSAKSLKSPGGRRVGLETSPKRSPMRSPRTAKGASSGGARMPDAPVL